MRTGVTNAPGRICFWQQYVSHPIKQPSGKLDSAFYKPLVSFPEGRVKLDCNVVQYLQSEQEGAPP
jgi:hypothetical protein